MSEKKLANCVWARGFEIIWKDNLQITKLLNISHIVNTT